MSTKFTNWYLDILDSGNSEWIELLSNNEVLKLAHSAYSDGYVDGKSNSEYTEIMKRLEEIRDKI